MPCFRLPSTSPSSVTPRDRAVLLPRLVSKKGLEFSSRTCTHRAARGSRQRSEQLGNGATGAAQDGGSHERAHVYCCKACVSRSDGQAQLVASLAAMCSTARIRQSDLPCRTVGKATQAMVSQVPAPSTAHLQYGDDVPLLSCRHVTGVHLRSVAAGLFGRGGGPAGAR